MNRDVHRRNRSLENSRSFYGDTDRLCGRSNDPIFSPAGRGSFGRTLSPGPDRPPRVVFNEFLDAALNILVIYWYSPPDYWEFMAFNQRINLAILGRFNDEGIGFAFPTQTLYLAGDPNRPLGRRQEVERASRAFVLSCRRVGQEVSYQ